MQYPDANNPWCRAEGSIPQDDVWEWFQTRSDFDTYILLIICPVNVSLRGESGSRCDKSHPMKLCLLAAGWGGCWVGDKYSHFTMVMSGWAVRAGQGTVLTISRAATTHVPSPTTGTLGTCLTIFSGLPTTDTPLAAAVALWRGKWSFDMKYRAG